jgi:CRISPR-associated protein Cmr4
MDSKGELRMQIRPCFIHALSPLHAGTGQAAELIDLPIARLKGSGIPYLPGSSIKGVLRDAATEAGSNFMSEDELLAIFGPNTNNASDHAGALICMDARLLCLPVRSFRGTFAYATSPLLLYLAGRDLRNHRGIALTVPELDAGKIAVTTESLLRQANEVTVYLEDLDLSIDANAQAAADEWAGTLGTAIPGDIFRKRFTIVSDDIMSFLWETATQVDTRVRIAHETRTVAEGALWLEESLPAETLLISMLGAERIRRANVNHLTPDDALNKVLSEPRVLQFGGKATVGRGRCRLVAA